MPGDALRPLHIANKLSLMATSEFGCHVESCQNQLYISTGHKLCPIFMKLALYDEQICQTSLLKFETVWPWQTIKLNGKAAKQEVSLFSATLYHIIAKLCTYTHDIILGTLWHPAP